MRKARARQRAQKERRKREESLRRVRQHEQCDEVGAYGHTMGMGDMGAQVWVRPPWSVGALGPNDVRAEQPRPRRVAPAVRTQAGADRRTGSGRMCRARAIAEAQSDPRASAAAQRHAERRETREAACVRRASEAQARARDARIRAWMVRRYGGEGEGAGTGEGAKVSKEAYAHDVGIT